MQHWAVLETHIEKTGYVPLKEGSKSIIVLIHYVHLPLLSQLTSQDALVIPATHLHRGVKGHTSSRYSPAQATHIACSSMSGEQLPCGHSSPFHQGEQGRRRAPPAPSKAPCWPGRGGRKAVSGEPGSRSWLWATLQSLCCSWASTTMHWPYGKATAEASVCNPF